MITYLTGDATNPQCDGNKIIAHVCNDVGAWGAGFVLAVSARWPDPEAAYRGARDLALGQVQLIKVQEGLWVANMVSQHNIITPRSGKPPICYEAVEVCLKKVARFASTLKASVHMPRIGCGLAGGKWEEIEPLIEKTLPATTVFVYDYEKTNS